MREKPAGWFVYRCSGSETGELEDLLVSLGIKAWTPRAWVRKRLPRRKARETVLIGILPSYLFVGVHSDLEVLAGLSFKHNLWGPMAIQGKRVEVADKDLEGLRAFENRHGLPQKRVGSLPSDGSRGAPSDGSRGPSDKPGRAGKSQNCQDASEFYPGDLVLIASGPLAPLRLSAIVERVEGDRVHLSATDRLPVIEASVRQLQLISRQKTSEPSASSPFPKGVGKATFTTKGARKG